MSDQGKRREAFRSTIAAFIDDRRDAKLKGKEEDASAASKYDYETWLADAAHRVGQIQAVTHVLKATHPDARGSSLHAAPDHLPQHTEVGTHLLGTDYAQDVVGNAAALDVFKFLKLEIDGRRLLDWMRDGDIDLRDALHPDPKVAGDWMAAFGNLVRSEDSPSSHGAAKQVYWLNGSDPSNDGDYHLLQPVFSSSLAHAVHMEIQEARFGEANTLARRAYRAKEACESPYRDYRGLAFRKLGGTKPQNISQLNSERRGVNYLLASLPPRWTRESPRSLLRMESVMDRFGHFEGVRPLVKALADFLLADPAPTMETREKRGIIEQAIGFQLPLFAAGIQARLEPGWTRDPDCQLPLCEQVWLDPERIELPIREGPDHPEWTQEDLEFHAAHERGDWPDEVAGRFANWLNGKLREAGLTSVGDTEYRHWARQAIIDAAWPVPMQRRANAGDRT